MEKKEKWLFNILRDNTLVDNQIYRADDGVFSNRRLKEPVPLAKKQSGQWSKPWNQSLEIWRFLNKVNREVQQKLQFDKQHALVLFNNKEYEHNTEDNFIEVSGVDSRNFTLKTGNLIGYVKKGDYALSISSRFGDAFLKHIIADADGFLEIEKYGGSQDGLGYEWLLIYLWKIKMKKAFRLGLPKKYQAHRDRLNKVRGQIDPVAYYRRRNDGKYLCHYREHSYDNPAARLIAATFRKIQDHGFVDDIHAIKNAFNTATKGVRVKAKDLYQTTHFSNPYYYDYNDLIDLSKLILRDQLSDFGDHSDQSAFFFDVSMLFEYYIRKLLIRNGFTLESKSNKRLEIPAGTLNNYRRKLEPDLVVQAHNGVYVFDVKYKTYDFKYGAKREDLFQLHTYVGQYGNERPVKACGLIYPIAEEKWRAVNNGAAAPPMIRDQMKIMGVDVPFYILFLCVPDTAPSDKRSFRALFLEKSTQFIEMMEGLVYRDEARNELNNLQTSSF